MSLTQLVYASSALVDFDRFRLVSLLLKARAYNAERSITGVLLHSQSSFVQCLEGDAVVVDELFQRTSRDTRHDNVVVMQQFAVSQRSFSDWMMGCVEVHESVLLKLQNAAWQQAANADDDACAISPGIVLMKSLWKQRLDSAV